jgi:hypothetical protein
MFFSEDRSKDTETDESERWTSVRFPFLKEEDSTRRHRVFVRHTFGADAIRNRGARWTNIHIKIIVESLADGLSNEIRKKDLFEISDSISTVAQKQQLSISSNAIVRGIDEQHFTSALFFATLSRSRTESERDLSLSLLGTQRRQREMNYSFPRSNVAHFSLLLNSTISQVLTYQVSFDPVQCIVNLAPDRRR